MVKATHLDAQPGHDAAPSQPADSGNASSPHPRSAPSQPADGSDASSPHPRSGPPAPPQPGGEGYSNQTVDADIIMALQARIAKLERCSARLEKCPQLQDQAPLAKQADIWRAGTVQLVEDTSLFTTMKSFIASVGQLFPHWDLAGYLPAYPKSSSIIIVRKIRDHTIDDADLEFLASSQATLDRNGELDIRKLSFAKADDNFMLRGHGGRSMAFLASYPKPFTISAEWVKGYALYEDNVHPFLNVIELKDYLVAEERDRERRRTQKIAERNRFLKGLIGRPFRWMASLATSQRSTTPKKCSEMNDS